jgi:hypothetical protein
MTPPTMALFGTDGFDAFEDEPGEGFRSAFPWLA